MGFSPGMVGLIGERVTGDYDEPRPRNRCPFHRGMDIGSSNAPKPFCAGIYGQVVAPFATGWGTVAVTPFGAPAATVQYLHCSSFAVSIGDVVAPWTILGMTGNTVPPGEDIPLIHLHIQVIEPGPGRHSCWNRNYVDPALFDLKSPLVGAWTTTLSGPNFSADVTLNILTDILSGSIGDMKALVTFDWMNSSGKNCEATAQYDFDVICTNLQQRNLMAVTDRNTAAVLVRSTCPFRPVISADAGAHLSLPSVSQLDVILSDGTVDHYTRSALKIESAMPRLSARGPFGEGLHGWAGVTKGDQPGPSKSPRASGRVRKIVT